MDKPAAHQAPCFALSDHALLVLEGRDAIAFAQAQCMNDVASLGDGEWQWSGWLTPKGRVRALFALLRVDAETIWLVIPDGDATALKAALERFVFRSKVKLRVPTELHLQGRFGTAAAASGAMAAADAGAQFELDLGAGNRPRTLRIGEDAGAPADAEALARWRAFDIVHGLPRVGSASLEAWTPQQLSLDRLKAYSVRKGCYPGQEIVARTHFLGQAKRGLLLFGSDGAPSGTDQQVTDGGRAIGAVVASAPACGELGSHPVAVLAVMPLERQDDAGTLQAAGHALSPLPLKDGLAR